MDRVLSFLHLRPFRYFIFIICLLAVNLDAQEDQFYETDESDNETQSINLRSMNGKLYAYIVLLFNENPHFVNIIQKGTIPLSDIGIEGFHVKEYRNYVNTIYTSSVKNIAQKLLSFYLEPKKFDDTQLREMEKMLIERNIVLKFSRDRNFGEEKLNLNYCIYGKKIPIAINHPFITLKEKMYNIQPYIYYDELSTSNSTFYFDMIYINPSEVDNDYLVAKRVINNQNVESMFFVGSRITDDIRLCLIKAFENNKGIRDEIWKMFVIHELTHKILNNNLNNFDHVIGEELSLCSTIYMNSYLGLAILYSYLNYNSMNPHRIAAMNYVRFISDKTGQKDIMGNPGILRSFPENKMKQLSKEHFFHNINEIKAKK